MADIVRCAGPSLVERSRRWISWQHQKVLLAITRCRTAALGGHRDRCSACGHTTAISYNSCRNRHCPRCQANARLRWLQAREQQLLPTRYVHLVFTLPRELAPLGGAEHALRYLSGYIHRIAISNRRLVALERGNVTFRWRDSAHANKQRLLTLPVDEFLRRFLLHLLPRSFMRIRNFGFLANRRRASLLPLCFQLLANSADISAPTASPHADHAGSSTYWNCPVCGGSMHTVERLSAAQLFLRSPPPTHLCAA
jgi:hypothetical protein